MTLQMMCGSFHTWPRGQLQCGVAHGKVGCLRSGTPCGLMSALRGGPGPSRQSPSPSGAALGVVHPSAQRSEEKRPLGRTWFGIFPLLGRVGHGTLLLRRWEPSQRVVLTVPGEDTAAGSPARGRESQCPRCDLCRSLNNSVSHVPTREWAARSVLFPSGTSVEGCARAGGDCATRGRRWVSLGEPEGVVGAWKVQTQSRRGQGLLGGGSASQQKPPSRSALSCGPGRRESRKPCRLCQEVWGWFPAWGTDETSTTNNLCPKRFLIYSL